MEAFNDKFPKKNYSLCFSCVP